MNKRKLITLVLSFVVAGTLSARTSTVVQQMEQVKISNIHDISGFTGDRIRLNREIYLKQFPIDAYVDFIVRREHTDWGWGWAEQHGKWIESAYLSALQSGDAELLEKVKTMLDRIIGSQEESGYLGATALSYRSPERPIRGMDPYELYFVFHAFITIYEETADEHVLESVKKLADFFVANFGPGKNEFWPSELRSPDNYQKELVGHSAFAGHSVHYCWEGTLLCDPMARLYQVTKNKKYLDWSQWAVANIDKWSGWDAFSRLDDVAEGKIGVDALQPYVHSHTFHMNFMGFLRLYMITGDKSYLRKVAGAWDDIHRRQMYITGGVSVCEHYEHDFVKPISGNVVETCATMSWMQLTEMLLQITGDTKYGDALERIILNHVFAAQDSETGICRYHSAPNGSKPGGFFHGPDCCTASGHRMISTLPTYFYAKKGNDFFINQYIASSYDDGKIAFSLTGNYATDGKVTLSIAKATQKKSTMHLRIPAWCKHPEVKLNGAAVDNVTPGTYCTLTGPFKAGDKISITFPLEERWAIRENHSEYPSYSLPGGEVMYREAPAARTPVAYMRGPVVYCMDMIWNPQLRNDDMNMDADLVIDDSTLPVRLNLQDRGLMAPAYEAKATYKGAPVKVVLTPFANVGRLHRDDDFRPALHTGAFTYGVWLYDK